jgi:hypothetical protein
LPQDQPTNSNLRLIVRPGITGWAQVNGGRLITAEEKGVLDDWYVQNASFWLDLRIALYTLAFLFTGERRCEAAVRAAYILQQANTHSRGPAEGSPVAAYQRAPVHRRSSPRLSPNLQSAQRTRD